MDEQQYQDFFDHFRKFKEKQDRQKADGLNDYNMVNIVQKETKEVGMHSNIIYSLINPNGLHYKGNLFLNKFIEKVLTISNFGEVLDVQVEEITSTLNQNRRIDFTIKSTKYYIGIEMKINHPDSVNQLSDYQLDLKNKSKEDNNQTVIIYYLTKDGKDANLVSSNGITYKKVSFGEHIIDWINSCQEEVKDVVNLNEAFNNYKQIVQKITNQYKGNVMTLVDYMKNNEEQFDIMCDIFNEKDALMECINNKFWSELLVEVKKLNQNAKHEKSNKYEWIEFEYKDKSIEIKRYYNLYITISDEEWRYIKIDCIKDQIENNKTINMKVGNSEFWQLGKIKVRQKLISLIIRYIKG